MLSIPIFGTRNEIHSLSDLERLDPLGRLSVEKRNGQDILVVTKGTLSDGLYSFWAYWRPKEAKQVISATWNAIKDLVSATNRSNISFTPSKNSSLDLSTAQLLVSDFKGYKLLDYFDIPTGRKIESNETNKKPKKKLQFTENVQVKTFIKEVFPNTENEWLKSYPSLLQEIQETRKLVDYENVLKLLEKLFAQTSKFLNTQGQEVFLSKQIQTKFLQFLFSSFHLNQNRNTLEFFWKLGNASRNEISLDQKVNLKQQAFKILTENKEETEYTKKLSEHPKFLLAHAILNLTPETDREQTKKELMQNFSINLDHYPEDGTITTIPLQK